MNRTIQLQNALIEATDQFRKTPEGEGLNVSELLRAFYGCWVDLGENFLKRNVRIENYEKVPPR